jgi:Icc-related predicted phosphoesterase
MKALIVADLHYSLRQFDWLLRVAADYDFVIIAGDLLDIAAHCDLDVQIVVVMKYLARIRRQTRLIVCSGNHDGDVRDEADEFIAAWLQDVREEGLHVDGESVDLSEGLVTICPWWDGPVARDAMERFLSSEALRAPGSWIWIHHAPPDRAAVSWAGHGYDGDEVLSRLIERFAPSIVISGHVHSSPFREGGSWIDRVGRTWVLNPGRQLGDLPAYISLDLGLGRAEWVSLAGRDEVDLAEVASPHAGERAPGPA